VTDDDVVEILPFVVLTFTNKGSAVSSLQLSSIPRKMCALASVASASGSLSSSSASASDVVAFVAAATGRTTPADRLV